MWQRPVAEVKSAGYYELVRNWRLGIEVAGRRQFGLMNLGPSGLQGTAQRFAEIVRADDHRRFRHVLWPDSLGRIQEQPDWLRQFLAVRGDIG